MNRKMVFYMIGKIVQAEAAMLLLPLVVALLYKETPLPFLITIGIALVLGIALSLIFKPKDRVIYAKEGFVIVAFAWIALSLIGCIPFVLSGALPNFFDAFFETVSGFTTTGASVMFWSLLWPSSPRLRTAPFTSCARKCPVPLWASWSPAPSRPRGFSI